MHCNCENLACPHGEKPCPNEAGAKKVMYVGAVCDACYERMPPEYRLPKPKPGRREALEMIDRQFREIGQAAENAMHEDAEELRDTVDYIGDSLDVIDDSDIEAFPGHKEVHSDAGERVARTGKTSFEARDAILEEIMDWARDGIYAVGIETNEEPGSVVQHVAAIRSLLKPLKTAAREMAREED